MQKFERRISRELTDIESHKIQVTEEIEGLISGMKKLEGQGP